MNTLLEQDKMQFLGRYAFDKHRQTMKTVKENI